mmetsp:Transcript_4826/g.4778  ORF Transcript_4826/g.4778 Transcript_4826/m.4778 type:complete len:81 (-) Transcript_4826:564-806(-)
MRERVMGESNRYNSIRIDSIQFQWSDFLHFEREREPYPIDNIVYVPYHLCYCQSFEFGQRTINSNQSTFGFPNTMIRSLV